MWNEMGPEYETLKASLFGGGAGEHPPEVEERLVMWRTKLNR